MPRNAPRTQPVEAAAGQAYGERQAQETAQQKIPLPQVRSSTPAPTAPARNPLEAAKQMAPPTPAPWTKGPMGDRMTDGLSSGPGPGREALNMQPGPPTPIADMLMRLADLTGDPTFVEDAQVASSQGR